MESILSLFIFHDTIVVSSLVVGITIIVVLLLLFSQKSPESVVKSELGSTEKVEGALRRVLGEKSWAQAGVAPVGVDGEKLSQLESEVLEKDRKIAELNKQLTHAGPSEGGLSGDDQALLARIAELEGRLEEYEIIEDDIADLSLYKTENEKLKAEIEKLKGGLSEGAAAALEAEAPAEVVAEPQPKPSDDATALLENDEQDQSEGSDLVAEFEKVVNNQETMIDEPSSKVTVKKQEDTGKVLMADELGKKKVVEEEIPVHPKLAKVSPNSKEEAEVFIAELKSLKSIRKGSEE